VYFIGTPDEVESNVLGNITRFDGQVERGVTWPFGCRGSFALSGNHEGFARFIGYYEHFLTALGIRDPATGRAAGQPASYSALVNAYWRVINLDTGYHSYSKGLENRDNTQPNAVIAWLRDVVKLGAENDTRGIILISHHQPVSAFLQPYTATIHQLLQEQVLPPDRTLLWMFGHEHRLSIYEKQNISDTSVESSISYPDDPLELSAHGAERTAAAGTDEKYVSIYPRCVGNGGVLRVLLNAPAL
jgi:hypothetical protein